MTVSDPIGSVLAAAREAFEPGVYIKALWDYSLSQPKAEELGLDKGQLNVILVDLVEYIKDESLGNVLGSDLTTAVPKEALVSFVLASTRCRGLHLTLGQCQGVVDFLVNNSLVPSRARSYYPTDPKTHVMAERPKALVIAELTRSGVSLTPAFVMAYACLADLLKMSGVPRIEFSSYCFQVAMRQGKIDKAAEALRNLVDQVGREMYAVKGLEQRVRTEFDDLRADEIDERTQEAIEAFKRVRDQLDESRAFDDMDPNEYGVDSRLVAQCAELRETCLNALGRLINAERHVLEVVREVCETRAVRSRVDVVDFSTEVYKPALGLSLDGLDRLLDELAPRLFVVGRNGKGRDLPFVPVLHPSRLVLPDVTTRRTDPAEPIDLGWVDEARTREGPMAPYDDAVEDLAAWLRSMGGEGSLSGYIAARGEGARTGIDFFTYAYLRPNPREPTLSGRGYVIRACPAWPEVVRQAQGSGMTVEYTDIVYQLVDSGDGKEE